MGQMVHSTAPGPGVFVYIPAAHTVQDPSPGTDLYVPVTHAVHGPPSLPVNPAEHRHSVPPEEESEFAGHGSQAVAEVAPSALLNVPASHARHADFPMMLLYVPAAHNVHGPPKAPVAPAVHQHSGLPVEDTEFTGHDEHPPTPVPLLYDPDGHAEHQTPSAAPLYPAEHLQSIMESLPGSEVVPPGHELHPPKPG